MQPKNEHISAAIKRAKQLTDFQWTPINDIPTYTKNLGNTVLPAGETVTGFPYGSEEKNDKFLCENVTFKSFLSAIPNPYSKIYQAGLAEFDAVNYGIVCNGLVRYALGIPFRVSTALWHTIPGMNLVKARGEYTVNEIELCDVLYAFGEGRNHVALITDIIYDESGRIIEIEVSEAVRPACIRKRYPIDEFYEKYSLFALWRYENIDDIPLFDKQTDDLLFRSKIDTIAPKITVDNGNESNYLEGEITIISAVSSGNDVIEVIKNDEVIEEIHFYKKAVISRKLTRGYYIIRLKSTEDIVKFCINFASIRHIVNSDQTITVSAELTDKRSEIHYLDFRKKGIDIAPLSKYEPLTDDEKQSGVFTREIPNDAMNYKVYFKNAYGIWTYPMKAIFETKK